MFRSVLREQGFYERAALLDELRRDCRRLLEQVLGIVDLLGIEEAVQLADTRRVAHLAERFGLDLTDALAGDLELLADLLERAAVAVHEAEAQRKHAALALGERVEDVDDLFTEERERRHVVRVLGGLVLDEVAEAGVVAVTDGRLERDGL